MLSPSDLELVLWGPTPTLDASWESIGTIVPCSPIEAAHFAPLMNARAERSTAGVLGFGMHADLTPAAVAQACDVLWRQPELNAALITAAEWLPGLTVFEALPDPLALFITRAADVACVLIRRQSLTERPFASVDEPVTHWLVQAVVANAPLHLAPAPRQWTLVSLPEPHVLAPAQPHLSKWMRDAIEAWSPSVGRGGSQVDIVAVKAGLYQWYDDLDESHRLAQSIEGEGTGHYGDYWHAIMHRREPDYGNAKYWFRRLPSPQPNAASLLNLAQAILSVTDDPEADTWKHRLGERGTWNPLAFVDLCEAAPDASPDLDLATRHIQECELRLLLQSSANAAWKGVE